MINIYNELLCIKELILKCPVDGSTLHADQAKLIPVMVVNHVKVRGYLKAILTQFNIQKSLNHKNSSIPYQTQFMQLAILDAQSIVVF